MERELEKTLLEIESAIKNNERRGNTHTQSVLEQAQEIIATCAKAARTPSELNGILNRDTAKVPNKKLRHRGGFETCRCPNCDTSYQIDGRYTITDEYCPICGKLLDSAFEGFCANCGQRISRQDWNDMQERKKEYAGIREDSGRDRSGNRERTYNV